MKHACEEVGLACKRRRLGGDCRSVQVWLRQEIRDRVEKQLMTLQKRERVAEGSCWTNK